MKHILFILSMFYFAIATSAMGYEIPEEDYPYSQETATENMEYMRCKEGACYFIKDGKYAGLSTHRDGVYLVWAVDDVDSNKPNHQPME